MATVQQRPCISRIRVYTHLVSSMSPPIWIQPAHCAGFFFAPLYSPPHSNQRSMAMKGKIADGEARERLIIWVRRRMEEFGITLEALAASIQHDLDNQPIYRDAKGNDWNGLGDMPDWLRAARNAGVSPD